MIRRLVRQTGKIPRGGFICSTDRRDVVEAGFILDF
jgi:hypothetical protein